jgi:hypothetical protein
MALDVGQSNISGEFDLSPTPHMIETESEFGYEVTVVYSVTPEEVYAGPPGAEPPPVS